MNKTQGIVIFLYDEVSHTMLIRFMTTSWRRQILISMAHARVKFEKAYQHGEDPVAKEFADMISELYDLED